MRVELAYGGRPGPLAGALAQLGALLLEPPPERAVAALPVELPRRPVIAVAGVARGCGTTTVARALAARLAGRDAGGSAVVAGPAKASPLTPATRAACRLQSRLGDEHGPRAMGRLCLCSVSDPDALIAAVGGQAPVVFDGGPGVPGADATIIVAPADAEPALAEIFARSLPTGGEPLIIVNRARADDRWTGRASLFVPESQLGARLAAGGWEPRGAFGRAISELAATCGAVACA